MWSCMGNVQRVVGPVVYCMQASASSIKEGRARLHALLDELCVRGHPVGGKLLLLEDDDSRRVGGALPFVLFVSTFFVLSVSSYYHVFASSE